MYQMPYFCLRLKKQGILKSTVIRLGEMNRVIVLIHIALVLISCSDSGRSSDQKFIRYNASNNITSLDPAFASNQDNIWAVIQLFNGLVQLDSNLNPVPAIAHSWEMSDSGRLFTFHLRQNVHFHLSSCFKPDESRIVTAHDFVYSFQRVMDPATASPGAWIFNDKISENGFVALDDSTLQIRLVRPFAPFVSLLSMPYCMVVPHEAIDKYGREFSRNPVGTGPYRFKYWEEDVKLILEKNQDYFESQNGISLPLNDGLAISFVVNKQMALLNFLKGELDFYNGIHSSIKDELLTSDGNLQAVYKEDFTLRKGPVLNTEYLAINVGELANTTALSNKVFRRALNMAIDRNKMIHHLRNNVGRAANGGFIPYGLPGTGHDRSSGFSYDRTNAQEIIDSLGYSGTELKLTTTKDYLDLCIFIQQAFKDVGVGCEIDVIPASRLKEQKMQGDLSFFRASWIADYPDAENYLSCFYSENFSPGGPNYTRYSNIAFDSLYDRSLLSSNAEERLELYRKMDDLVLEEAPVIVLFYDESMQLTSRDLLGLPSNALNIPQFKFAHWRE